MKRKSKTFKTILSLCLVFGLIAAVGIGAYLTDTDVKQDVYTVGNVQAEIIANGDMELDNVGALLPGTVHTYERAAMNTGINDAYMFMSLTIPYEMVGVSEDDGTQIGERVRQLFIPGVDGGYIGSEWKLVDVGYIGQYEIEDNGQYCGEHDQYSAVAGDTITYVYGYVGDNADGSLKALASGETTSNLVETMTLTNLYNVSNVEGEISTNLYAIQSNYVNGGITDVNGVWAVINKALFGDVKAVTLTYNIANTRTGDAVGYAPLKLVNERGNVVSTSVATESGNGQFQNVPAGTYTVETDVGELSITGTRTYGLRRSAVIIEVKEDKSVNLGLTTPVNTLVIGTEFNSRIPSSATRIEFVANRVIPDGSYPVDVSEAKDGSVLAWSEGTTFYVSSLDGDRICANPNSYRMFASKSKITYINTENLDMSTIANGALIFYQCSNLTNTASDFNFSSMTNFEYAFDSCSWLTEIEITAETTAIGKYAFRACTNLTSVIFEDGSNIKSIGECAFAYCMNLTSIEIPSGVEELGLAAFADCKSLSSITIPANLKVIGNEAFRYDSSLTEIKFAEDCQLTTIDDKAFIDCTGLTSITLPQSLTLIDFQAFSGCKNLVSVNFEKNSNLNTIYNYAFQNCTGLEYVYIPASTTTIGQYVFNSCSNLKTVEFEQNGNLEALQNGVFYKCSALSEITIPASVKTIGENVLADCIKLTAINVEPGSNNYVSVDGVLYTKDMKTLIQYPVFNANTTYTIPEGVEKINPRAFYQCKYLTELNMPSTMKSIGTYAFYLSYYIKTINYNGTQAQWNAITKGSDWNGNCPAVIKYISNN